MDVISLQLMTDKYFLFLDKIAWEDKIEEKKNRARIANLGRMKSFNCKSVRAPVYRKKVFNSPGLEEEVMNKPEPMEVIVDLTADDDDEDAPDDQMVDLECKSDIGDFLDTPKLMESILEMEDLQQGRNLANLECLSDVLDSPGANNDEEVMEIDPIYEEPPKSTDIYTSMPWSYLQASQLEDMLDNDCSGVEIRNCVIRVKKSLEIIDTPTPYEFDSLLCALFTDDTMQHYNWTGQLGKKAICTSKLYKIIQDVLEMEREKFHKIVLDSRRKLLNRVKMCKKVLLYQTFK